MQKLNSTQYLLDAAAGEKWARIGVNPRAGVATALFSLYSSQSQGIGDLEDLKLLIDWAKLTANSIIQLLPMNELGAVFCPYDSLSSFALEPLFLSLRGENLTRNSVTENKINTLAKNFPIKGKFADYSLKPEKLRILWEIFSGWDHYDSLELKKFREENSYWLEDFTLYKVIKKYHHARPWYEWEESFKERDKKALEIFCQDHAQEINFEAWLQWKIFQQFRSVKEYARGKNILLKGDLPILVSRDSADVWAHREFFKLEFSAGAPPDMYCAKGQRWGMPTYNWEGIVRDNYRYLKEKLKFAQNFYDILRIDHVVGLFRIWSIPYQEPAENMGLNGFFDPLDDSFWGDHGRNILKTILESTDMLLCAEDLGVIPQVCTDTLKELGIPGNDVGRWVKDYKSGHDFLSPDAYRQLSVAMLSTHDTTNWAAWWENEAGTVDEGLWIRKCSDHRQINFENIKPKLFDLSRSGHGRLRWLDGIDSVDKLLMVLGKGAQEVGDFIDLYLNTYHEKEKLWVHLGLKGPMREKCDNQIMQKALKLNLDSGAIFSINTIVDYLYLGDIFSGDPYQYRINTPGTISNKNWSLTIPLPLEELLKHKVNKEIRKMVTDSKRR